MNKCKRGEGVYMIGNVRMELPLIINHSEFFHDGSMTVCPKLEFPTWFYLHISFMKISCFSEPL